MKRRVLVVVASGLFSGMPALLGCAVVGAMSGCYQQASFKGTKTGSVAHLDGKKLFVDSRNGSITVTQVPGEHVSVTASIAARSQARLDGAALVLERDAAGDLHVSIDWPGGKPEMNEGASFDVGVPGAGEVELTTANGAVTLTGLAGPAAVRTSNGAITISGHDGAVIARTSNGRISITGASKVSATTSNGAIDVALSDDAKASVKLSTSNGGITFKPGKEFAGLVRCSTSNGSISSQSQNAKAVGTPTRTSASFRFGDSDDESIIETSNGSITVR